MADKPNPFGAALRKTGSRPEDENKGSATNPGGKPPLSSNTNSNDKPNPFGHVLKSSSNVSNNNNKTSNSSNASETGSGTNPFGAVLKKTSSGNSLNSTVNTSNNAAKANSSNNTNDKPNPFGAVLKSANPSKPTTPKDTTLTPTTATNTTKDDKQNKDGERSIVVDDAASDKAKKDGDGDKTNDASNEASSDGGAKKVFTKKPKTESAAAADPSSASSSLPEGWAEKKDPNTGKTYYYNKTTKKTQWTKPENEAVAAKTTTTQQETPTTTTSSSAAASPLPEGWKEKIDPETGKTFYSNKSTGETSWKRPTSSGTSSATKSTEDDKKNNNTLPTGWAEKKDPNTGKTYYYNKETKKTSWTRPAADPEANNNNDSTSNNKSGEEKKDVNTNNNNGLPEGWKEKIDPTSGKPYYYHKATNKTSWKHPGGAEADNTTKDETSNADNDKSSADTTSESQNNNDNKNDELPEGWRVKTDPATNKPFYYNRTTNETSWKHPAAASTKSSSNNNNNGNSTDDKNIVDPRKKYTAQEINEAWIQVEDDMSGRRYWANKLTNESSWLKPKKEEEEKEEISSPEKEHFQPTSRQLHEAGWAEAEDTLGQRYYYDLKTKEVSWLWPPTNMEGGSNNNNSGDSPSTRRLSAAVGGSGSHQRRRSSVSSMGLGNPNLNNNKNRRGSLSRRGSSADLNKDRLAAASGGGGADGGFSINVEGPDHNNNMQQGAGNITNFSMDTDDNAVEIMPDGTPVPKRKTFFMKRGSPCIYVLGGEGVCDSFRLVMTRNQRLNEWKYLPHLCLPDELHTICCAWNWKDSKEAILARQRGRLDVDRGEKIARVWAVPTDQAAGTNRRAQIERQLLAQQRRIDNGEKAADVMNEKNAEAEREIGARPIEFRLNLFCATNKTDTEAPEPEIVDAPFDTRPVPLGSAVTAVGQAIICCGGFTDVAAGTLTDASWLYDLQSEVTIDLPPLNVARSSHTVVIVDRSTALQTTWIAYALGGFNGDRKCNVVERYLLGKDCWEVTNPMSTARSGFAAVAIDRTVYAIGGRSGYGIVNTCESMHAQTNQWAPICAMKNARAMHSAIVFDGNIVVVGGWDGNEWTNTCERYDPNIDKWTQIVSLPVPVGHPMLALGDLPKEEAIDNDAFG